MKKCCKSMWNKIIEAYVCHGIKIENNYCPQCGSNYADMLAEEQEKELEGDKL